MQQLDEFLSRPNQMWLLGAGVSLDAGLPLMYPLTDRVIELAVGSPHKPLLDALLADLPRGTHIEHVLSQLGDYNTLARRSSFGKAVIGGTEYTIADLEAAHTEILKDIADTVRWGYKPARGGNPAVVGWLCCINQLGT
ncbi:hypothetical protein HAV22_23440 [Massilia sp. TW-1]|uniref:SIR2-like domain-containing protein n=1 Tax=Telluria antibiotica TaxID=2717319 RepID=A0ABX0PH27_9BURK|nr:hypothetical protein [Telluria antibiotica]